MRQGNTGYLEGLTVLENLVYAAMLRFPGTVEQQSRRVHTYVREGLGSIPTTLFTSVLGHVYADRWTSVGVRKNLHVSSWPLGSHRVWLRVRM